ncbi:uncharacterized protein LOC142409316 [Mycteria americana]|uniref:uncharacterized protein LOC142409316 n=1 Tax=Mycteria americana TaxID=33587 RepID=UPI003F581DA4
MTRSTCSAKNRETEEKVRKKTTHLPSANTCFSNVPFFKHSTCNEPLQSKCKQYGRYSPPATVTPQNITATQRKEMKREEDDDCSNLFLHPLALLQDPASWGRRPSSPRLQIIFIPRTVPPPPGYNSLPVAARRYLRQRHAHPCASDGAASVAQSVPPPHLGAPPPVSPRPAAPAPRSAHRGLPGEGGTTQFLDNPPPPVLAGPRSPEGGGGQGPEGGWQWRTPRACCLPPGPPHGAARRGSGCTAHPTLSSAPRTLLAAARPPFPPPRTLIGLPPRPSRYCAAAMLSVACLESHLRVHLRSLMWQVSSAADQTCAFDSCSVIHPASPCPAFPSAWSSRHTPDTPDVHPHCDLVHEGERKNVRGRGLPERRAQAGSVPCTGLCCLLHPLSVRRKQRRSAPPLLSPLRFARTRAPSSELCFRGAPWTRQNCSCGMDVVLPFDLAS